LPHVPDKTCMLVQSLCTYLVPLRQQGWHHSFFARPGSKYRLSCGQHAGTRSTCLLTPMMSERTAPCSVGWVWLHDLVRPGSQHSNQRVTAVRALESLLAIDRLAVYRLTCGFWSWQRACCR
jgi:hypothetical protein